MESFLVLIAFTALSLLMGRGAHGVNEVQENLPGPLQKDINSQLTLGLDAGRSKRQAIFSSCAEVQLAGHRTNGVYTLQVFSKEIEVYCDLTTGGGGWAVLQRRDDYKPLLDFYQNWMAYKTGFGDINKDFWLSRLDNIHLLTSHVPCSLRIELGDFEGNKRFAHYNRFHVAGESNNYKLLVEGFSGDAADSLSFHNGQQFSTLDRDNDSHAGYHCAVQYHGGWWYAACHVSNLNGKYLRGNHSSYANGVEWSSWRGQHYSLKKTEMKIRPVEFLSYISL